MRRAAFILAALFTIAPVPTAAAEEDTHWGQEYMQTVVDAGLMAPSVADFRPDDVLTKAEFAELLTGLTGRPHHAKKPEQAVRVAQFHKRLVNAVGLGPAANQFRIAVGDAGLTPPKRIGFETVARLLGLRINHDAENDARELLPRQRITRVEAAYSIARVLGLEEWRIPYIEGLASSFALPEYTPWQNAVLTRAVQWVGYPYVWGGYAERKQRLFGREVSGGFDCSGFIWRVYKTELYPDAPALNETIVGRTTYSMSGAIKKRDRIRRDDLQPGDLLFFGNKGPKSKPKHVGHSGIYLGAGWIIHSSRSGTTLHPLSGWYEETFAWARRPLAEAGLA